MGSLLLSQRLFPDLLDGINAGVDHRFGHIHAGILKKPPGLLRKTDAHQWFILVVRALEGKISIREHNDFVE